jgi:hypothetical protein
VQPDSTLDITHIRLQKTNSDLRIPGATAALRAAAEAARDVSRVAFLEVCLVDWTE